MSQLKNFIARTEALAGSAVAEAILSEFAGQTVYIQLPEAAATPMPSFRLCGTFPPTLPMAQGAGHVASVAIALAHMTDAHVMVEVDTRGLGDAYLEHIKNTLRGFPGLSVIALDQGAQA